MIYKNNMYTFNQLKWQRKDFESNEVNIYK